jgi:hypothetical protein
MGQVVDVFGGIENILSGWNTAHGPECRTHDAVSEALRNHSCRYFAP